MSKFKENTLKSKLGKRIHRRIVVSGLLKASAVALLGWHIRKLQIEDSEDYKLLADANRVNLRLIPPSRGLIFDRLGKPIAVNEQNYKVVLIREQATNPRNVLTRLSNIIDLDQKLQGFFGVNSIHSEYGMTELLSQGYSPKNGVFRNPPWMKTFTYELNNPFKRTTIGEVGRLNIIDLANQDSCSFISTDDIGRSFNDYSYEVLGRVNSSDIRGCNLLFSQ